MLYTWQEFTSGGRPQGGTIPEDLRDFVENVSPVDRPALSLFRKTRINSTYVEWLEDSLTSRGDNAWLEGVDATDMARTTPTRTFTHVQLFADFGKVSDVQRAVEHKGFADAFLYQERKSIDYVLNCIEHAIHRGSAATGATNAARRFNGLINAASTLDLGGTIDSSWSGATMTEDKFGDMLQAYPDANIDVRPSACFVNSYMKRTISNYDTNVNRNIEASARLQMNVIERYSGDFGDIDVYFSRDQTKGTSKTGSGNSITILDPSFFEVAFLQPLQSETLPRGGLSTPFVVSAMCTLIYRTEKAICLQEYACPYLTA